MTELGSGADLPGQQPAAAIAAAAERVCHKLCQRLSRSISPAGAQAIVSRALHLARAKFPFLQGVQAGAPPDRCLVGLAERVDDNVGPDEATRGLQSLLIALLGLLVGFLGEDLTVRLVRDVWPALPTTQVSQPTRANGHQPGA